jgi:hypothetical protein
MANSRYGQRRHWSVLPPHLPHRDVVPVTTLVGKPQINVIVIGRDVLFRRCVTPGIKPRRAEKLIATSLNALSADFISFYRDGMAAK